MDEWQPDTIRDLRALCGARAVLTDPTSLISYENDALGFHRYKPDAVVIPADSDQLKEIIGICRGRNFPYILRGAGTSLSGGPVAAQGGLVIHVSRLRKILAINEDDMYCVVEPGVVLDTLNAALKPHGLLYPPDPSSSYTCTVGGNVAENAGGVRCFKYGPTANYVLGMEVLLTDGRVVQLGGPAGGLGPAGGCDWKTLMVGSEGMLGVFTKLWLRTIPLPERISTSLAAFPKMADAANAIVDLVHHPSIPVAIELMDNRIVQLLEASPMAVGLDPTCWAVMVEIDGPAALVDAQAPAIEALLRKHGATDIKSATEDEARQRLWAARKNSGGLLGRISADSMVQDAVIPRSKFGAVLEKLYADADEMDVPVFSVFHAGDGNLHPNFSFDGRNPDELRKVKLLGKRLMEYVIENGGVLSGEHGIGTDKREYVPLFFGPRELAMQSALAECLNPDHQLNPEKVYPHRSFVGCCAPVR
tara:strand:- start:3291 stop:4718 length:1428 start_codon:yes stop_codon:yes gene_type:complete